MPRGRHIYVTGTPGTGVEQSIRKFIEWRVARGEVSRGNEPILLKLEDHLRRVAAEDVERILRATVPANGLAKLYDVLRLPKPVLANHWREAFRGCVETAEQASAEGRDVFMTFHASWYHLGNKEYISAIDFRSLSERRTTPNILITLIDDIYDVRSRLSAPGGVLAPRFARSSELVDSVLKLLLILDWRASEIMLSERAADTMDARHFLLAVKHPLRTLNALLYDGDRRRTAYLSHHISELRRMQYKSVDEKRIATEMIRRIQALARELRDSATLFEPTTIDEARFDYKFFLADGELIIPRLGERWPPASDESELAWVAPLDSVPEFGREWKTKSEELTARSPTQPLTVAERAELGVASALVQALVDKVISQINSRDHFLVEHSDGIVVYRPYLLGHEAGGVKEELQHHHRLVRAGISRATAVILHPAEDEALRPRRMAQRCCEGWRETGEISGSASDIARLTQELPQAETLWRGINTEDPIATGRHVRIFFEGYNIQCRPPATGGALGPAAVIAEERADGQRGKEFLSLLGENYLSEMEGAERTVVLTDNLSTEAFARRAVECL
jgi:hypothetical protein